MKEQLGDSSFPDNPTANQMDEASKANWQAKPLADGLIEAALVDNSPSQGEIVTAKLVETAPYQVPSAVRGKQLAGTKLGYSPWANTLPPPIPKDLDNVSAVGGAVAAMTLGGLAVLGSFVTSWAIVNSILGIPLGLWGMSSRRRQLAIIGLILCGIGFVFSTIQINDMIQFFIRSRRDLEP